MPAKNPETNEVSVKKIVVQLGKKELILDIEDAKELKKVLNELFGVVIVEKAVDRTVIEKHYHYDKYVSPYQWNYPTITYGSAGGAFKYDNNIVYCSSNTSNSLPPLELKPKDDTGEIK